MPPNNRESFFFKKMTKIKKNRSTQLRSPMTFNLSLLLFFSKTYESCASLQYRESKNNLHTSTPLIRGSVWGSHHTGTSLNEKEKQHDQPRPKLTQIVPLRPRFCNFLAPAKHQRLCSSFSSRRIELTEGEAPSYTQAFLCFEITQPSFFTRKFRKYDKTN